LIEAAARIILAELRDEPFFVTSGMGLDLRSIAEAPDRLVFVLRPAASVSYVTSARLTPRPAAAQADEAGSDGTHEPVSHPRQATAQADTAPRSADPGA
jgi:hypothetical protein